MPAVFRKLLLGLTAVAVLVFATLPALAAAPTTRVDVRTPHVMAIGQPATITMSVKSANDTEMIGILPNAVKIITAPRACAWARGGRSITCSFMGGKTWSRVRLRVMPIRLTPVQQPPLAKLYAKSHQGEHAIGRAVYDTDTVVVVRGP